MVDSLRGSAAVVGIGLTKFGRLPDRTHMEIMADAISKAIADAGINKDEIDGIFSANFVEMLTPLTVAEYLGINPTYMDGTNTGGSVFVNSMQSAAAALSLGLCNVALICYGSNSATGPFTHPPAMHTVEDVYRPRNPISPYALAAKRHMHEFGTTKEQLAEVAVSARAWAQLNPAATMRDPLTIEDVVNARMIVDPLGLLDCCLVSDGGAAMIMVRKDRAKDFPKQPVYMLGVGSRTDHNLISCMPDLTTTAAKESAAAAFAMAGVTPEDIDVVELYDAFTINTILFLEDMGFCEKGEGGSFVSNGNIAPGGSLPVNTNGGGLSCVHPGMYGMFLMIEAVQQLRGECGDRQIKDAKLAACNGNGGFLASQVTAVFGTEETL
ncbi:MAG: acetyl-CoA acetyltransferase [Pseudohongiellaceae bacterium]|jgi:acetyl-CoA acetyltransferase|tara:strand:- start:47 stop:1192 length:1146 start_codon:yes stop_codon:yes gene_type:complete